VTDPDTRGPDTDDVRAARVAALEEELRRLRERATQIRAELADLRDTAESRVPPPAQWSQATVTTHDIELVLRTAPETEWTVASIREHLPDASEPQLRRRLLQLKKRGLVRTPARGRYVLVPLSSSEYRRARSPRPPLRERVLDVFLADEHRAWTKRTLATHLELPDRSIPYFHEMLARLQREHYVVQDNNGWLRPLPASARDAFSQRPDTEILGAAVPITRKRCRRTTQGR
jgi:hypothetical protein